MHVVSTFSPSPAIRLPLSLTSVCLCTCTRFHHLSLRHVLYTPTPLSPPFAISSRPTLCFLRLSSFAELLFLFSLHLLFNAVAPAHLFVFPVQKCLCMCVLFFFFFLQWYLARLNEDKAIFIALQQLQSSLVFVYFCFAFFSQLIACPCFSVPRFPFTRPAAALLHFWCFYCNLGWLPKCYAILYRSRSSISCRPPQSLSVWHSLLCLIFPIPVDRRPSSAFLVTHLVYGK